MEILLTEKGHMVRPVHVVEPTGFLQCCWVFVELVGICSVPRLMVGVGNLEADSFIDDSENAIFGRSE